LSMRVPAPGVTTGVFVAGPTVAVFVDVFVG
jgi:hypothetical protein